MARVILSEASVRIGVDTRGGERDAERAGEDAGRDYAKGAQRQSNRNPIRAQIAPIDASFEAALRKQIRDIAAKVTAEIPLNARGEQFRQQVAARIAEIQRTMKLDVPTNPKLAADFRRKLQRMLDDESRRVSARASFGVDVDNNRITRSLSGLAGLFGRAGERVLGIASTAFAPVSKIFDSMNLSLSGVIIAITAATVAAPLLAAALSVVGGAATAALGAISAGAIGLPVVLASLIAPIAAIAIGMDGIKRAAEPLKDELKSLRDSVNIAFELGMRPVFGKLQTLFPTLNVGLAEVARGVVRIVSDFAGILTAPAGIENVRVALAGVSDTIDRMRPGLASLFNELLKVAGTRELYDILGDTIGGIAHRFAGLIDQVRSTGDLTAALEQLRDVLFGVVDLISVLVEGSITFFAKAGPGLTAFFKSLTETISRIDFGTLGEAFGSLMERLGNAIQRVPPETWQKLADAIGSPTGRFLEFVEGGGLERMISGFATMGNILSWLAGNYLLLFDAVESIMGMFDGLGSKASSVGSTIGGAFGGAGEAASAGLDGVVTAVDEKLPIIGELIDFNLGGMAERTGGFFSQAGERISENWQTINDTTNEKLTGLGESLDGFFSNLPDRIGYWTGYLATSLILDAQEAVDGISLWFEQLPGRIEAYVLDMAARFIRFFSELPGKAAEFALLTVGTAVNAFKDLPGKTEALARDMSDRFLRFLSELPGKAVAFAVQTIDAVVNAFRDFPKKVAEGAQKTVDDVIKWFKELPGKLKQAAIDAIQGFIDGIKEKARSMADAAKDAVKGALRGARDAIDARSPSRAFRDLGRDTIQGYIVGLREKLAPLLAQIKSIFSKAISTAGGAGGLASLIPPGITENVTQAIQQAVQGSRAGMVQAEDGSWVSPSFYSSRPGGPADLATILAEAGARAKERQQRELAEAVAAGMSGSRFVFDGPSVVRVVNDENRQLARL